MNFLPLLLGAAAIGGMSGGTPREVNNLKNQIPKEEQNAFIQQYKSLSKSAKSDFKTALKNADLNAASQIIGQDLTKYNVALKPAAENKPKEIPTLEQMEMPALYQQQSDIVARIEKILAVPSSIDPALVAEAAKKYEAAVPSREGTNIAERTRKILEAQG